IVLSVLHKQGSVKDGVTSEDGLAKEVPVTEAELEAAREAWQHGAARRPTPKPRTHPVYVYTSITCKV
ncbi:unnamed protein product, partial [Timema podura]|nr:unnamed protein product [Timema podura]